MCTGIAELLPTVDDSVLSKCCYHVCMHFGIVLLWWQAYGIEKTKTLIALACFDVVYTLNKLKQTAVHYRMR